MAVWAPSALFSVVSLVAAAIAFLLPETTNKNMPEENDDEDEDVSPRLSCNVKEKE